MLDHPVIEAVYCRANCAVLGPIVAPHLLSNRCEVDRPTTPDELQQLPGDTGHAILRALPRKLARVRVVSVRRNNRAIGTGARCAFTRRSRRRRDIGGAIDLIGTRALAQPTSWGRPPIPGRNRALCRSQWAHMKRWEATTRFLYLAGLARDDSSSKLRSDRSRGLCARFLIELRERI